MDLFFKKYHTFHFLYFFCIVIFICEAKKTHRRSSGSHHHHHSSSQNSKSRSSGTKAQQMCDKYVAQACDENSSIIRQSKRRLHSNRSTKRLLYHGNFLANYGHHTIVGGRVTRPKEYPHMARVGYYNRSTIIWDCGGSLISENFVMSAGHCVPPPTPTVIRLGESSWESTHDGAKPVDYKILKIFLHPRYDDLYLRHDIALFKFQGVEKFTDYIRPICLNVLEHIPKQKLVAVGWGKTAGNEPVSKDLLSVELDLESSENCKTFFADGQFDRRIMLCVGYAPGGKDTCGGDSGGPLQIFNNQVKCSRVPIYTQVGITSGGSVRCGAPHTPAKYTKVSSYIPWIESIVWN